jgi:predicted component of type VI protein secretion system
MITDSGSLSGSDKVALDEQVKAAFVKQVTSGAKDSMRDLVRVMLPEIAQKVVKEEIGRIHAKERSVEIDGEHLTAAVREAFAPQVETMARDMVKELVAEMLPKLAEEMVISEIERIKMQGSEE